MLNYMLIIFLALLFILFIIATVCGLQPLRRTGRFATKNYKSPEEPISSVIPADAENREDVHDDTVAEDSDISSATTQNQVTKLPPVSVIVYSFCNEERLQIYLNELMQQDYPDFEVVLVLDGGPELAADISESLKNRFPKLHITFVPSNSHNLSRRKLAWALGIKGASNNIVLTTAANCNIPSRLWLRQMIEPMADKEISVVLGVTRFDFNEFRGASKWYHQFERVIANSSWISRAAGGKPYRGDCYNMTFRKNLFFDVNGYAASIGKPYGDDDIFIGQITTSTNTRVVLSPETLLVMDWGISTERVRVSLKEQQHFAAQELPAGPFLRRAMLSATSWLILLLSAAIIAISIIFMLPELPWPAIAAGCLLLSFWGCSIAAYRKAATALHAIRLWWSVPLFILWRPIVNFFFHLRHRRANVVDFIWNGYE